MVRAFPNLSELQLDGCKMATAQMLKNIAGVFEWLWWCLSRMLQHIDLLHIGL